MKPILDWLVSIGGSPVDVLLMAVIIGQFVLNWNQKRLGNAEMKCLEYKYSVLNSWAFGMDGHTKYNRLKSGNSQGDKELDWDGIPERLMTVNMFKQWIERAKRSAFLGNNLDAKKNTEK